MVDERVLVVPRTTVFPDAAAQGFIADNTRAYLERMQTDYRFEHRRLVEDDPSLKQLIPYVVFMYADNVFLVRRSTAQSEQRLVGMHSIGIGGHINTKDASESIAPEEQHVDAFSSVLTEGLYREIHEEVSLCETPKLRLAGLINDDSNAVGKVHLGLVYVARLSAPSVSVREREMMTGCFVNTDRVGEYYDTMESWSQIVIDSGCLLEEDESRA